jgi:hypothetical protein
MLGHCQSISGEEMVLLFLEKRDPNLFYVLSADQTQNLDLSAALFAKNFLSRFLRMLIVSHAQIVALLLILRRFVLAKV